MRDGKSGSPVVDRRLSTIPPRNQLAIHPSAPRSVSGISQQFARGSRVELAVEVERRVFARDLHDGLLQELTGIALQVNAASQLIATDPDAARARLDAIGCQIAAEQAELRAFIHRMTPIGGTQFAANSELAAALEKVRSRTEQLCGLRIELLVNGPSDILRSLGDHVYRIVQEALANVVRHARARVARIEVSLSTTTAHIIVADDGIGFPIRGRLDLAALKQRNCGPVSIRERVEALRGELVVTSSPSGSTLDISVTVEPPAISRSSSRSALRQA